MVKSIKKGQFTMEGEEWRGVSDSAKELISGLLAVNATQRLTLEATSRHSWLQPHSAPTTELLTNRSLRRAGAAERAINQTMKAFHEATQNGFVLRDPTNAPLAKKRKKKHGTSPLPPEERDGKRPNRLELSPERT